jgi:hypothetical protein
MEPAMGFRLIPREEKFFDLFEESAGIIVRAAGAFQDMIAVFDRLEERAREIKELEHAGDLCTERIYRALDRSFLTPMEPEDIHRLGGALDDVLDNLEEAAHRFWVFRIDEPTLPAKSMAKIIHESCSNVAAAVKLCRNMNQPDEMALLLREIGRLENKGDQIYRDAEAHLFAEPPDPLTLIKWRELYDRMEGTIDACREVSNVLSEIVLKGS